MFLGVAWIVETTDEGRRLSIDVPLKREVFLFGTDANGRDLFTRTLIAGRVSLAVGLLASFVALTIGVAYGAVAGYAGGRVDALMMRIVEIVYALPFIFFVIVLVMVFGRHFALIFVTIGAVEWLDMARIVRGQTLSIKQRDFVAAAEALGASAPSILWRHVIPNASGPIACLSRRARSARHPARKLRVVFGPWRARAADELGRACRRWRPQHPGLCPSSYFSRVVFGRDARRVTESWQRMAPLGTR